MGAKPKVKIIGGSFLGHSKSMSLREDNANVSPTYFEWTDDYNADVPSVFYAGGSIRDSNLNQKHKNVAILIEPPSLHPENYEYVKEHHDKFHAVLTYSMDLLNAIPNGRFYPLGGSSIAFDDWGLYPKTKDVCMIVSEKDTMPGHKLRHDIVKEFEGKIDFYGAGVGKPFERKFDVLKDYKWCIVVESEATNNYFSEKFIDAMSVGCIPIYHVDSHFHFSFNFDFIHFFGLASLRGFKEKIMSYYAQSIDDTNVDENIEMAKNYAIAEDWIYLHYPELFT